MHLESGRLLISISKLMDSCFPQNLYLESRTLLLLTLVRINTVETPRRGVSTEY
jgi:hypothetical protein